MMMQYKLIEPELIEALLQLAKHLDGLLGNGVRHYSTFQHQWMKLNNLIEKSIISNVADILIEDHIHTY